MTAEEVRSRLEELTALKDGWCDRGSIAPRKELVSTVKKAADALRADGIHVHLSAAGDGTFLLTAIGVGGRDADIWIEEPDKVLAVMGDMEAEDIPIANVGHCALWLTWRS